MTLLPLLPGLQPEITQSRTDRWLLTHEIATHLPLLGNLLEVSIRVLSAARAREGRGVTWLLEIIGTGYEDPNYSRQWASKTSAVLSRASNV